MIEIEVLFEIVTLKRKPNYWFEKKTTPTYYDWNEVEQTSANSSSDKEIYF